MAGPAGNAALLASAIRYALGSVAYVTPHSLARPTPCAEWDLATLLRHVSRFPCRVPRRHRPRLRRSRFRRAVLGRTDERLGGHVPGSGRPTPRRRSDGRPPRPTDRHRRPAHCRQHRDGRWSRRARATRMGLRRGLRARPADPTRPRYRHPGRRPLGGQRRRPPRSLRRPGHRVAARQPQRAASCPARTQATRLSPSLDRLAAAFIAAPGYRGADARTMLDSRRAPHTVTQGQRQPDARLPHHLPGRSCVAGGSST
jgi:hypothetical protein